MQTATKNWQNTPVLSLENVIFKQKVYDIYEEAMWTLPELPSRTYFFVQNLLTPAYQKCKNPVGSLLYFLYIHYVHHRWQGTFCKKKAKSKCNFNFVFKNIIIIISHLTDTSLNRTTEQDKRIWHEAQNVNVPQKGLCEEGCVELDDAED